MKKIKWSKILVFTALCLMSLTFLYPLIFMTMTAMKSGAEYLADPFALPKSINLDNFEALISRFKIMKNFLNTFIVVGASVVLITIFSVFASYAFTKLRFRGRNVMFLIIIATMFITAQVTMIPMYVIFAKFKLVDTYTGVVLSYLAMGLPSTIMLMTTCFRGIDKEVMEAAKIDGAGYFGLVANVIVPMGIAGVAMSVITNFIGYWNDLFTPMILLKSMDKRTVMVALSSLMADRTSVDPTFQMTGLLISVIPTLIIYLLFQKYMTKGLTAGAIK